MDILIFIGFIWVIGWLYCCGEHHSNKEFIKKHGDEDSIKEINQGGLFQYVVLFFGWPHYLGYR